MLREKVYIGLGSNLGQREGFLQSALHGLHQSERIELLKISPVYETEPVGFPDQDHYLNIVAHIKTDLPPQELMDQLEGIESKVGKKAEFKNGPREIDMDILLYDQEVLETDKLIIPHPGLNRREFALRPLLDLDPKVIEPTTGTPYSVYLGRIAGGKMVAIKKDMGLSF
jgi:2-amino-4-hydroxy-6-hydroxymethyldihydropteridine diphosphokinase